MKLGPLSALFIATFLILSLRATEAHSHIPTALDVLELPQGANQQEVTEAYKRLLKMYHPDSAKTDRYRAQLTEVIKAYKFIKERNFNTQGIQSSFVAKSPEKKKIEEILKDNSHLIDEPANALILVLREIPNLKTLEDHLNVTKPIYQALIEELQTQQPRKNKIEVLKHLIDDVFTHLNEDKDHPHGNYLISEAMMKVAYSQLAHIKNENPQAYRDLTERALTILDQLEDRAFAYDLGAFYQRMIYDLTRSCAANLK